jgi:hypothetical protein
MLGQQLGERRTALQSPEAHFERDVHAGPRLTRGSEDGFGFDLGPFSGPLIVLVGPVKYLLLG